MSDEPKRFNSVIEMLTHDCHKYALENERLKAEVERLTNCKSESDRLKAEVERLRKAGDMCDQLLACFEMEGRRGVNIGRDMWRAAKEGKQP